MNEIAVVWVTSSIIISVVLGAKFLGAWCRHEPESYRRWGKPNLCYNFGAYLTALWLGT